MLKFKKRARIFSEKLGGVIDYGKNDSLNFQIGDNSVVFTPVSKNEMNCTINLNNGSTSYQISKDYIFDIIEKLCLPHLSETLLKYKNKTILQLSDYINEENGQKLLDELRQRIVDNPSLETADLGGNRIIVEYYRGILVISDDILWCATNVIDF